jgi:hypothetical protein
MPIVLMHLYQQQNWVFADKVVLQVDQNNQGEQEY